MTIGRGLIVILGNSGAGKSTLAHWLARELGAARQPLPHLDLDTVAWLPHQIAAARPPAEAEAMLRDWMAQHPRGVLEGCYGALARVAIAAGAARRCNSAIMRALSCCERAIDSAMSRCQISAFACLRHAINCGSWSW